MKDYLAPLQDIRFVMRHLADMPSVMKLPGFEESGQDTVDAILDEAAKFAGGVLSPLNRVGDVHGARYDNGKVTTPPGWQAAYRQFNEGGWGALSVDGAHGGMGLPRVVSAAVNEMWNSANLAFALCPMLTSSAIEALILRGSAALQARYIPPLLSGQWSGTMNLTEPQAGSDLAAIRTRADKQADGSYKITGQKIYITYGEHDLAENIIHMVLARTPDAPPGVKGISLFLVPKRLVNADGSLGEHNDVRAISIEHKLGIHASPTCTMAFGEAGGAVGYLVGEENRGLEIMFIMMNAARFAVGVEGLALAERAYQAARDYALERVQGATLGGGRGSIIGHPDVRRMLMLMKSQVEAMRALAYVVAMAMDHGERAPDPARRVVQRGFGDLMIPVVKGWCTETAVEIASLAIQVYGGMGYVEETGVAQLLRDARITSIYEGTTAIQANDLVGRKLLRDRGAALRSVLCAMQGTVAALVLYEGEDMAAIRMNLAHAAEALAEAEEFLVAAHAGDAAGVYAGSVPFLKLLGITAGGWQMARAALASAEQLRTQTGPQDFHRAKILTARFYAEHILPQAQAMAHSIRAGGHSVMALSEKDFEASGG